MQVRCGRPDAWVVLRSRDSRLLNLVAPASTSLMTVVVGWSDDVRQSWATVHVRAFESLPRRETGVVSH